MQADLDAQPPQVYPYMWALVNAIFLLLALGAVLDPTPQTVLPKLTGSFALVVAGAKQSVGAQTDRTQRARLFTVAFLALDVLFVALLWTVR